MLEKELKYYLDHRKDLIKKYSQKYIVIVSNKVVGSHRTQVEAYNETIEKYELGTFLIQFCAPEDEAFTHTFHSRIAI